MFELQAAFPVMVASNLEELKTFYESFFGFNAVFFDPSFYLHLVSPTSGVQLGFLMPDHPSQPDFLHKIMDTQGYIVSFEIADAASDYEKAVANNMNIAMPLKEEVWGQLHFIIQDPAGFYIDMVQHLNLQ